MERLRDRAERWAIQIRHEILPLGSGGRLQRYLNESKKS